jgi:hypothetical protein
MPPATASQFPSCASFWNFLIFPYNVIYSMSITLCITYYFIPIVFFYVCHWFQWIVISWGHYHEIQFTWCKYSFMFIRENHCSFIKNWKSLYGVKSFRSFWRHALLLKGWNNESILFKLNWSRIPLLSWMLKTTDYRSCKHNFLCNTMQSLVFVGGIPWRAFGRTCWNQDLRQQAQTGGKRWRIEEETI